MTRNLNSFSSERDVGSEQEKTYFAVAKRY